MGQTISQDCKYTIGYNTRHLVAIAQMSREVTTLGTTAA